VAQAALLCWRNSPFRTPRFSQGRKAQGAVGRPFAQGRPPSCPAGPARTSLAAFCATRLQTYFKSWKPVTVVFPTACSTILTAAAAVEHNALHYPDLRLAQFDGSRPSPGPSQRPSLAVAPP